MKKLAITVGALALPLVSFAALGNVEGLVTDIGNIVNKVIPILFAIALLVFFWGLIGYIFASADDKEKKKKTMIWGIVALFIMASVWGLVRFLGDAFGIGQEAAPDVTNLIPQ